MAISENGDCFKRQIDRIPTSRFDHCQLLLAISCTRTDLGTTEHSEHTEIKTLRPPDGAINGSLILKLILVSRYKRGPDATILNSYLPFSSVLRGEGAGG